MIDIDLSALGYVFGAGLGAVVGIVLSAIVLLTSFWLTIPAWLPWTIIVVSVIIGWFWGGRLSKR